jgi:signal transduction histidine kinase
VEPGTLVAPLTISHVLGLGNQVALALAPFLFLLFPTGRLPSRRWRPLAWISALSGAMILVLVFLFDNPDKVGGTIGIMAGSVVLVIFATLALSAFSLLFRYRRAGGVERQQLKWVAFAAVLAASFLVGQQLAWLAALLVANSLGGELPGLNRSLENLLNVALTVCLYAGVGIAILRYRLYDIDIIINRTLVYGSLTVSLALVYFGGVISLQGLLRALTGQGSQLAIVGSTLAIAALFNPLHRRIQGFIDRRFYRRKYDARKTLEEYSTKLRDETNLEELSGDLVWVVRETVQPEHVTLWLREPEKPG